MKLEKFIFILFFLAASNISLAAQSSEKTNSLQHKRLKTISQYLHSLETADAKTMNSLFIKNAVVISTSKGKVDPTTFFPGFFSEVKSAKVTNKTIFKGIDDLEHYAARFSFSWVSKNGEHGGGNYMDDFVFPKGSSKLSQVFMFENKLENS